MLEIKKEVEDIWALRNMCWMGAIDTVDTCIALGLEDELMRHLEETFKPYSVLPDQMEINDYLRFETPTIYKRLGITQEMLDSLEDDDDDNDD